MEIGISLSIIVFISLNLVVYSNEKTCGDFDRWLLGSLGIYTLDLIVCMNQLMQVKKFGKENHWLLLFFIIILIINASWYIWGNILYYRNRDNCLGVSTEVQLARNPGIGSAIKFMLLIGYLTFAKCFFVILIILIGIPCLCYFNRRTRLPQP